MKEKEDVKKKRTTKKKETKEEVVKEKKTRAKKETKEVLETKKEKKVVKKETKKEEEVLLDSNSQKYLRVLSKVVSILAKIGRICLMIVIPFIFILMIAIPFLMKKLEVSGNIIKFSDATIIINEDYVTFKIADSDYISNVDYAELTYISNFLVNNSKGDILLVTEVSLAFVAAIVIISIYILIYIEKLFKNICEKKTPFIEENADYIRRIGHMVILCAIISFIFDILLGVFFPKANVMSHDTFSIFEILIIFIIYYVFKYAVNLQKKSDTKIYK